MPAVFTPVRLSLIGTLRGLLIALGQGAPTTTDDVWDGYTVSELREEINAASAQLASASHAVPDLDESRWNWIY